MLEEALDFNGPESGNELILDEKLAKEPWIEEVTLSWELGCNEFEPEYEMSLEKTLSMMKNLLSNNLFELMIAH